MKQKHHPKPDEPEPNRITTMNRDFDVIPCIPFIPVNKGFKNLRAEFNRDEGDIQDKTVY